MKLKWKKCLKHLNAFLPFITPKLQNCKRGENFPTVSKDKRGVRDLFSPVRGYKSSVLILYLRMSPQLFHRFIVYSSLLKTNDHCLFFCPLPSNECPECHPFLFCGVHCLVLCGLRMYLRHPSSSTGSTQVYL